MYVFFDTVADARMFAAYADKSLKRWQKQVAIRKSGELRRRFRKRLRERMNRDDIPFAVWAYKPPRGRTRLYARIRGALLQIAKRYGIETVPVAKAWRDGKHPPANEVDKDGNETIYQERIL